MVLGKESIKMTQLPKVQIRKLFGGPKKNTSEIHEVSAWHFILRMTGIDHSKLTVNEIAELVRKNMRNENHG